MDWIAKTRVDSVRKISFIVVFSRFLKTKPVIMSRIVWKSVQYLRVLWWVNVSNGDEWRWHCFRLKTTCFNNGQKMQVLKKQKSSGYSFQMLSSFEIVLMIFIKIGSCCTHKTLLFYCVSFNNEIIPIISVLVFQLFMKSRLSLLWV